MLFDVDCLYRGWSEEGQHFFGLETFTIYTSAHLKESPYNSVSPNFVNIS